MKPYFLILVLLLMSGCAAIGPEQYGAAAIQIDDIAGGPQTRPAIAEFNGVPALLYATKDDRVAFQIGNKRELLDETARVKGGRYFKLNRNDQILDAMWWSHQDGKNLYFTSSTDGGHHFAPVSMVNDGHGVLPPYSLIRGGQGVVGITYLDERQPKYQAYFNRSTDDGRTWGRPDQRLDTPPADGRASEVLEPQSLKAGKTWVSAWVEIMRSAIQTTYRIVNSRSEDEGLHWTAPEVLYSSDRLISSLLLRAQGGSIAIAADENERGIFALTSQDEGRSWLAAGFVDGSNQASNSGVDMALAGGRAHLVWMQDRKDEKTRIMRASLDVSRSKWLDSVQRLDMKAYQNTRSISPAIVATTQGTLLAAWVDYRDIRPNIYVSGSYDQGQAWTAPQAVLKHGELSAGWPQLIPWGDQAAIAYEIYPTESVKDGKLVLKPLSMGNNVNGITGLAEQSKISEQDRKSRLEKRVKTFWESRVEGNHEPVYDMFDFAYKLATTKKMYLESVGVITYLSFSIDGLSITGNEAKVKIKTKYEIKPTMLPTGGKPLEVPPVEVEFESTWVWVGSDWYMVFAPAYGPQELKY